MEKNGRTMEKNGRTRFWPSVSETPRAQGQEQEEIAAIERGEDKTRDRQCE
jgi:hypothetical protein